MMARVYEHTMYLDSQDMFISKNLADGKYHELNEVALIKRILKEGDIALDIGAHIGYFTLIMARLVGKKGKVFAFEPSPVNFELLKKNIELNKYQNIYAIPKGISNKRERTPFYLNSQNSGNSSLFKTGRHDKEVQIKTLTLDHYFFGTDFNIDFAKIDVEGSEPLVIEGMKTILKRPHPIRLVIEFYPQLLKNAGFEPKAFLNMLKNFGLRLYFINKADLKEVGWIEDKYINHPTWHRNIYCERTNV